MTPEETRQLGIEFERRVQTMIPEKEYLDKLDTDTIYAYLNSYQDKYIHDIYRNLDQIKSGSKLSAHVEAVLQEMLRTQTIDVEDAKNNTQNISDENGIVIIENGRSVTYPLDPSFYMYVRSVSRVSSTFSFKSNNSQNQPIRVLPNELVSQSDVWRLLETPHNSLRILRYPAATIGAYENFGEYISKYTISESTDISTLDQEYGTLTQSPTLNKEIYTFEDIDGIFDLFVSDSSMTSSQLLKSVLDNLDLNESFQFLYYDGTNDPESHTSNPHIYTVTKTVNSPIMRPTINVIYDQYTTPEGIKIMYYAQPKRFDIMTNTACELPMDAFDDLVTGAVDLYVQYVAGAEANKRRIQEAQRQQAKQNKKDNEDED